MADDQRPRWLRLVSLLLPAAYRREIIIDLWDERNTLVSRGRSRLWAATWLLAHVTRSAISARWIGARARPAVRSWRLWPTDSVSDLRRAVRSLCHAPWYAGTVVAVTALSIALAATVFAVVDGVLFKPLPYPHPDELYAVSGRFDGGPVSGRGVEMVSAREVAAWSTAVPDLTMTRLLNYYVPMPDGPGVFAAGVDASFFEVFGVKLLAGGFRTEDYANDRPVKPVVVSYRLWQDRYGGDRAILGRTLPAVDDYSRPLQVVGILARDGFVPPLPAKSDVASRQSNHIDLLTPNPNEAPGERSDTAFARIPPGQRPTAQAALNRAALSYRDHGPSRPRPYDGVTLVPLHDYVSSRERPVLGMAFGMAMGLVLVVLLNVGALTRARTQQHARDLALRRALGARTRDLLRCALVEQIVLFTLGAAVGLLATPALLAIVLDLMPPGLNLIKDVRVDWRVTTFAGVLAAGTAVAVALVAVGSAVRQASLGPGLSSNQTTAPAGVRLGRWLVAGQSAVAFGLVVTGGLAAASLTRIWHESPGIRVSNTAMLSVFYRDYRERGLATVWPNALVLAEQIRTLPEIDGAALLDTSIMQNGVLRRQFPPPTRWPDGVEPPATVRVSSDFFDTAGINVVSGRPPTDVELDSGAPVVVVTEAAARAYWPQQSPLGRTLRAVGPRGGPPVDCTVIGVVPDVRLRALDIPSSGVIFMSWALPTVSWTGPKFLIASRHGFADALSSVVARVSAVAPTARVTNVTRLADATAASIRERRLLTVMGSTFGSVALVFIALGVLGLVAMTVSRRTREVGIRIALGARTDNIARQLVGEYLGAVIGGVTIGGAISIWVLGFVRTYLYETTVYDLTVWAVSLAVVLGTAGLAALIPALQASHVDPVVALRQE